jgi:hypothetical protein
VFALNSNGQALCLTEPFTFQKPDQPIPDKGGNDNRRGGYGSDCGDDVPGVGGTDGGPGDG